MRRVLAVVAGLIGTAFAQDGPEGGPPTYSFAVEQGWSIASDSENDFPDIQENELQAGLGPRFRPPLTGPTFPLRDRDGKVVPRHRGLPPLRKACDPVKLEGSITLLPEGACRLQFKRIEYWDRSQRYSIEFQPEKVRTHELGGLEKWSGSRAEWTARLERLSTALQDAYLKVLTPRKPSAGPDRLGLEGPTGLEPAWRLFVSSSLEEQMAALFLAALDGARMPADAWPAGAPSVPDRPQLLARALLRRILAQARGTLSPEPSREHSSRTLTGHPWTGSEVAIPSMGWEDGGSWARERLGPIEQARARLRALAENSGRSALNRESYLPPEVWQAAVEDEAKNLRRIIPVAVLDHPGTLADALLPRIRNLGAATYDFKEKVALEEGLLHSSEADTRGAAQMEVVFFHSGMNVWRASVIRLETWYKSKIIRV
ncbi:MAG TPA: hypothetical protein VMU54_14395, partial [Planctomycetota bacterium]|nr:hypothetical protein [Planctomycetota bacterium]